jgi:site-specific recombinase XerD
VIARALIESGATLDELTVADLGELEAAFRARATSVGVDWGNDRGFLHAAWAVLYHLGIIEVAPPNRRRLERDGYDHHFTGVTDPLRALLVAYTELLTGTHAPTTVTAVAIRLAHFGRHLAGIDASLTSLADLDRCRHIEPYLTAVAAARRKSDGAPVSIGERRNRIITLRRFLTDIVEWGWPDAPTRPLVFTRDIPRLPRALPRYLAPDTDRQLTQALAASPNPLFADALMLARATGLRIGELVDLELDCVHEVPGQGAWLKVPLGKLATERMVPLDDHTVDIVDRLVATRSPGRPLAHPRTGRPAQFLLTHHGKRVCAQTLRDELARVAHDAGLGHITPHTLRHSYATALVNAGVSLQALMALLGHTSAAMSLRYGRLFDTTVRAEYERALTLAKDRLGPVLPDPPATPVNLHTDWRDAPAIKARLAGGFCMRAPAQGACPYANICEHCPNFRTDAGYLPVLAAQRLDTEALAADAEARGWIEEAGRHRRLIERLDTLMDQPE